MSTISNETHSMGSDSTVTSNGNAQQQAGQTLQNAKDTTVNYAQSTYDNVANHPQTQQLKDTIQNSPIGQSTRSEANKVSNEFSDLADAKRTPDQPAATGQPLTHYHSMFYRLLSWKNPRATLISYFSIIAFILAARYLNVLRYLLKGTYIILGSTALAEIAGQTVMGQGLASQIRPRRYFTIPKESLERFLEDFEQLINFFVIEFQRIIFAENVYVTVGAFIAAFSSYWLMKIMPTWGLTMAFTTIIYFAPLVYLQNKEFIDSHLEHASNLASEQATQLRDMASHHTNRALETTKQYTNEYTKVAGEYMGAAKQKTQETIGQAQRQSQDAMGTAQKKTEETTGMKAGDFPNAPSSGVASSFPDAPQKDPISDSHAPVANAGAPLTS